MDTRADSGKSGALERPALAAGKSRKLMMQNSECGIPAAAAYSLNFAVVAPAGAASAMSRPGRMTSRGPALLW